MSDDSKGSSRPLSSSRPARPESQPPDLNREREQILQTFAIGAKLTEQLIEERDRLRRHLQELEAENARLETMVKASGAIRDLIDRIDQLEREKKELIGRFERVEADSSTTQAQVAAAEQEFANMANLFVASNQLHTSLSPRGVARRLKEILAQLVGAEGYAVFLLDGDGQQLVPIAHEGLQSEVVKPIRVAGSRVKEVVETGVPFWVDGDPSLCSLTNPAAIIPLTVEDQQVGAIVIAHTYSHKHLFESMDLALFKLLSQHAGSALVGAALFVQADRRIPGLEAFVDLSV